MNNKYWAVAYPNGYLRPCNTRKRASTLVRRYNAKYGLRGSFKRALVVPLEQQVIEKRISVLKKVLHYITGKY